MAHLTALKGCGQKVALSLQFALSARAHSFEWCIRSDLMRFARASLAVHVADGDARVLAQRNVHEGDGGARLDVRERRRGDGQVAQPLAARARAEV